MYMKQDDWKLFKNFKPTEFACPCKACNRSKQVVDMDISLLWILQALRNKYGAVQVTCGYRCQKYNDTLQGSIKTSYHIKRKAADIYIKGICDSVKGRQEVIEYIKTLPNFRYAYHNVDGTKPYMGKAIHLDVL